ncbi:hypothetical protein [Actinoplanes sp. NPDC051851]|uniref:hypothetical protein n=1 Tax=Actinoplanes sp. NPDC051851 TaxID=3154753 RepID=UPI00343708B8
MAADHRSATPALPLVADPPVSRNGQLTRQLGAVLLLGAFLPLVFQGVAHGYRVAGNALLTTAVLAVLAAGTILLLVLLAGGTRAATPLGATTTGRVTWAFLVTVAGGTLWTLGWLIADSAELEIVRSGRLTLLSGGLLFVLVAAVLTHSWPLRILAALLLLAVVASGALLLRNTGPTEADQALRRAGYPHGALYVVTIPGYRSIGRSFGASPDGDLFEPTTLPDGADPATFRISFKTRYTYPCAHNLRCSDADTTEAASTTTSSLTPTIDLADRSGFVATRGRATLQLTAGTAVDPTVLRTALREARPPTDTEILHAIPAPPPTDFLDSLRRFLRHHL